MDLQEIADCTDACGTSGARELAPASGKPNTAQTSPEKRERAVKLKDEGNVAYKQEDFETAISLFTQATQTDWTCLAAWSNLAASYYESGKYHEGWLLTGALMSLFDLKCSGQLSPKELELYNKLVVRVAKCGVYAGHGLMVESWLGSFASAATGIEPIKHAATRFETLANSSNAQNKRVAQSLWASLPRVRPAFAPVLEYYPLGHDVPMSLLSTYYTTSDKHNLDIKLVNGSNFSAVLGGCGDSRHLVATLVDIQQQSPKVKNLSLHFTLVDIKSTALARALVLLFILDRIARLGNAVDVGKGRDELALLQYTWFGNAMPPSVYAHLLKTIREVAAALAGDKLPSWLYVSDHVKQPILAALRWWLSQFDKGCDVLTSLERQTRDKEQADFFNMHLTADERARVQKVKDSKKVQMQTVTPEMRAQALAIQRQMRPELNEEELQADVDMMLAHFAGGGGDRVREHGEYAPAPCWRDREGFTLVGALMTDSNILAKDHTPQEIRHFALTYIDQGADLDTVHEAAKKVKKLVQSRWQGNPTFHDEVWDRYEGRQTVDEGFWQQFQQLHQTPEFKGLPWPSLPTTNDPAGHIISQYMWIWHMHAAEFIARLSTHGNKLKVELTLAELGSFLDCLDVSGHRPGSFPTTFDRIHLSNVPDYLQGTTLIYSGAARHLKQDKLAAVMAVQLLNCGAFEGGYGYLTNPVEAARTRRSVLYTYSRAKLEDTSLFFGVKCMTPPDRPADYSYYCRAPFFGSAKGNKATVQRFLVETFFALLPVASAPNAPQAMVIRQPSTLLAWLSLCRSLLGQPHIKPHWVSEVIEALLVGEVVTDGLPATSMPIALALAERRLGAAAAFRVDVHVVQLQAILSLTLAAGMLAIPAISDRIVAFETLVRVAIALDAIRPTENEYRASLGLLVAEKSVLGGANDLSGLRSKVVSGKKLNDKIHLFDVLDWDHDRRVVSFWCSQRALEQMKSEQLGAALLSTGTWRLSSAPVDLAAASTVFAAKDQQGYEQWVAKREAKRFEAWQCDDSTARHSMDESANDGPDWAETDDLTAEQSHANRELAKLAARHSDTGYREGISAGKASTLQDGFNDGFARFGSQAGRRLGQARGRAAALLAWLLQQKANEAGLVEQTRSLVRDLGRLTLEDVAEKDPDAERHALEHDEPLEVAMEQLNGSEAKATLMECESRLAELLKNCDPGRTG